jgi:hypothetical protein
VDLSASAPQTGQLLDDATLEACLFQGMTVPVLAMTELGTLRVDKNSVRNSYGGFWLVSLNDPAVVTMFDYAAVGDSNAYKGEAQNGRAAILDRIFVIATAIGQVLPAAPPGTRALVPGKILPPSTTQLARARQIFGALPTPAAKTASPSPASPPRRSRRMSAEATPSEAAPVGLPSAIENLFTPPRPVPSEPVSPVTETPASGPLRLDFGDCDIDAVIAASNSGAGLLVLDYTQNAGSVLIHDSQIRSSFPRGETVLAMGLEQACVTANILANEIPLPAPTDIGLNSRSIVLYPVVGQVAITGNVCIGPTILYTPGRPPTIPWMLTDWNVFNTVIAYVPPPVVTGLSRASGTEAGGDTVRITGSGFSGVVSAVNFGQFRASVVSHTDTDIIATSPPGWGTVDVTVTTPAGTSAPSAAGRFTYTGPLPVVNGISPSKGPAGRVHMVTITGSGFTGATGVNFEGDAAVMNVVSDMQIIAISPAVPQDGDFNVAVTTPAGTSAWHPADVFSYYYTLPAVTGVWPASTQFGDEVTITGTGFTGSSQVKIGEVFADLVNIISDTEIKAYVPRDSSVAGTQFFTVTNPAGTSAPSALSQIFIN